MPSRDRYITAIVSAAIMALLLGVYVGAYQLLAVAVRLGVNNRPEDEFVFLKYRVPNSLQLTAHRVFEPMHWLDRRMRPKVWKNERGNILYPSLRNPSVRSIGM